jgi:hypothetical protein
LWPCCHLSGNKRICEEPRKTGVPILQVRERENRLPPGDHGIALLHAYDEIDENGQSFSVADSSFSLFILVELGSSALLQSIKYCIRE